MSALPDDAAQRGRDGTMPRMSNKENERTTRERIGKPPLPPGPVTAVGLGIRSTRGSSSSIHLVMPCPLSDSLPSGSGTESSEDSDAAWGCAKGKGGQRARRGKKGKKKKQQLEVPAASKATAAAPTSKKAAVPTSNKGAKPSASASVLVATGQPGAYDPAHSAALARAHPDPPTWGPRPLVPAGGIEHINTTQPLALLNGGSIRDQAPITGMSLSHDGSMLLTLCNTGSAYLWDLETFQPLQCLRDGEEEHIDEFYVGRFTPDDRGVVVAGKLKDRYRWSEADQDNQVLPCPLKLFDVLTSRVEQRFDGHEEEVLGIKAARYRGTNYYISCSQDGYLYRWAVEEDWKRLHEARRFVDGLTCMAFTISFLPGTGCRYFLAACDDSLKLFDMESLQMIQVFGFQYSFYCDCAKFINPVAEVAEQLQAVERPAPSAPSTTRTSSPGARRLSDAVDVTGSEPEGEADEDREMASDAGGGVDESTCAMHSALLVSRGVELLDAEENTVNSTPNTVTLHRLVYPERAGELFRLVALRKYQHAAYQSNSWLVKIASNGRYVAAPTYDGRVFFFHLVTGQVCAVLKEHEEVEVRDVLFHPTRPLLFTSADDGTVKVFTSALLPAPEDALTAQGGSTQVTECAPASRPRRAQQK